MPRLLITITDEMDSELRDIAAKRSAPIAALVREALEEWLEKRGKELTTDIVWGRRPSSDQTTPQKDIEVGELGAVVVN